MKISSNIQLLKTNETVNERLGFSKQDSRDAYYSDLAVTNNWKRIDKTHYKQKNSSIFLKGIADTFQYNYLRVQSPYQISDTEYGVPRFYYYFIVEVTQVNAKTIRLDLALDVIGTYLFEIDFSKPVFCERITPKTNEFGQNVVDEYYDLGEHRVVWAGKAEPFDSVWKKEKSTTKYGYVVASAETPVSEGFVCMPSQVHGIYSGISYFYFPPTADGHKGYLDFLNLFNSTGHIDSIVAITLFPRIKEFEDAWKESATEVTVKGNTAKFLKVNNSATKIFHDDFKVAKITSLKDLRVDKDNRVAYKPVCKKLFQYPYTFYAIENLCGGGQQFRPENFYVSDNDVKINFDIALSYPARLECYLSSYNESNQVDEDLVYAKSLTYAPYGMCNWVSNFSETWLAQNSDVMYAQKMNTIASFNATKDVASANSALGVTNASSAYDTANTIAYNNSDNSMLMGEYSYASSVLANNTNSDIEKFKNILGSGKGAISGGISGAGGGTAGVIAGASGSIIDGVVNNALIDKQTGLGNTLAEMNKSANLSSTANSLANSLLGNKNSYDTALRSASVAYTNEMTMANVAKENSLRSLMASVSAIQSMPSTIKGDTTSNNMDLIRDLVFVYFKVYQGDARLMQRLDLYFQMFGYADNNFEVLSSFITRDKSCFYKTVETAKGKHEDYVGLTDKEKESKKASYSYYNDIYNRNVPDCDYVKTVNADFSCKEYGIVPKTYVELINQIFNSGIRFWHSTAMKFILTDEDFKDKEHFHDTNAEKFDHFTASDLDLKGDKLEDGFDMFSFETTIS